MLNRRKITLKVNGEAHELEVEPRHLLADALREGLGLTGTHIGCEHGVCGACTILLDGESIRSCLLLAVQAEGHEITTVEGLGDSNHLNLLQRKFREHHALQCGFCTPGMLMTATELLNQRTSLTERDIRDALSGNLCRCTGYDHIIAAISEAIAETSGAGR
ncbi:MAG: (2Fe-2S)-binding protein [Rhodospirillales bacterium]